ncbi:MAG TPA: S8 family serine peptidase, partial [Mycobacteriales bacterium]|nr:S8 family serine peptidase [Mycobacteriales bacterium]
LKIFGCGEETGTGSDLIAAALDWAATIQSNGKPRLDVVNMSIGADFTTADDPDAVAADNASLAGVTVVAAAGNAGDEFNAAGAPGNAVRAISVAASDDTTDLVDGVTFSDESGNQPAEESSAFNWSTDVRTNAGAKPQQLAVIGDGKQADFSSPTAGDVAHAPNNSDGCDPLSAADKAKAAGRVLLLSWTDNDSARRCGSAVRTKNANAAGALGVVLVDDEDEFAAGILGDASIPTVITTATAGNPVVQDVFAGKPITATLTFALHNKVTSVHPGTQDAIATFSSRGGGEAGLVKPDISAPGVTVFSALFGSGNDGTSNNGTSMATPHVTGSAALVKAVHPTWTPEQVKAALMNTAGNTVFARAVDGSANHNAPEAPERAGAGRVQV